MRGRESEASVAVFVDDVLYNRWGLGEDKRSVLCSLVECSCKSDFILIGL